MFQLPSNFTTNVGTNATSAIGALAPVAELVVGVLLAVLVLSIIINTIKK